MAALGNKQRILGAIGLDMMLVFTWLQYMYDPASTAMNKTVKEYNALVGEINTLNQTPVDIRRAQSALPPLEKKLKALTEETDALKAAYLATGEVRDEIIFRVNDAARNNVIRVHEITPTPLEKATALPKNVAAEFKTMDRAVFKVRCSGDFIDFFAFIRDLGRMNRLVSMESLIILKAKEQDGHVDVEFFLAV
ncbi:type 4a pilus biogenesis protein PilO [Megalodesulfovibrio paquesii]